MRQIGAPGGNPPHDPFPRSSIRPNDFFRIALEPCMHPEPAFRGGTLSERRSISRILLMEDEPGLARVLTRRLQEEGYAVEPVTDDESGLALATCGGFDLLLLGSMLPRRNALDVCRTLRRGG